MNTTEIIHKEHFEHWLFSQAEERGFNYGDGHSCMGCSFVKETTQYKNAAFGGNTWFTDFPKPARVDIPQWLVALLHEVRIISGMGVFTIADTKRAWAKLFPETEVNIQPAQSMKEVK